TSVTVCHSPCNGPFVGNLNYVEVIVSEPTSTFLATVIGRFSMTPGARAVAGTGPAPNCLIALQNLPSTSLTLNNNAHVNSGCGVASNGVMNVGGGTTSIV